MNRRQKDILINTISVLVITTIAVVAMINLKNLINRSEAKRAMEDLSQKTLNYKKKYGSIPPESYINTIRQSLEGHVRLGGVVYRAQWIDLDSTPDEILAYTERFHSSWLFGKKYIILRLDGRVEWMDKQNLDTLLAKQQTRREIELLQKESKQTSPQLF